MNSRNRYGYLKSDCLSDTAPVDAQSSWSLTDTRDEQITILTSLLPDGSWVYGYNVYWKNGRVSTSPTSAHNGLFHSQREAQLYAVGFMLIYLDYFTDSTKAALHRAERTLIQSTLF